MGNLFGGIEAGGTKFICAVGTGPDDLKDVISIETTTPEETIGTVIEYLGKYKKELSALGIGSFGPIDLRKDSATYGYITSTPKKYWGDTNIVGLLKKSFVLPIGFDTDVNAAALGEYRWGAAKGLTDFIYLTVGTGIGGGGMVNGKLLHGAAHPEMGHILIPHDVDLDPFPGKCPFHKDCLEGLASGPAIKVRWRASADTLKEDHPAWDLEAGYLAAAVVNFIFTLSPQRIILGGGVMGQKHLIKLVRQKVVKLMGDYGMFDAIRKDISNYIVLPKLGDNAGILGSIALAEKAYEE